MPIGQVIRVEGPTAIVRVEGREERATLRGALKAGPRTATHLVATGDRVRLGRDAVGAPVIEEVQERRNRIARVDPGDQRRAHTIAANIDALICVQSYRDPKLNLRALDRLLLLGFSSGVPPAVVVNKLDLRRGEDPAGLDAYPQIGVPVLRASARDGTGTDAFRALLSGKTTLLTGPSGSGKSSLLNASIPGVRLPTHAVSRATSKGVHTTVRVEWIDLPEGGAVLDTPGLRAIQPWGVTLSNLAVGFPEFSPHQEDCRFTDCLHKGEPDCAVRHAAERGLLSASRYDSYLRIMATLEGKERRGSRSEAGS